MDRVGGGGSQDWTESAAATPRIGESRRRRQPGLERVGGGGSQDWRESAAAAARVVQSQRRRQLGFDRVGGGSSKLTSFSEPDLNKGC